MCSSDLYLQSCFSVCQKRCFASFLRRVSLRSAPRLCAKGAQFDARSAQRVFPRHMSLEKRLDCICRLRAANSCRGLFDWLPSRRSHGSISYCTPSTGSHHSLPVSSPGHSSATWENQLSFAAPCQCFIPAGMAATSPGSSSRASWPHS